MFSLQKSLFLFMKCQMNFLEKAIVELGLMTVIYPLSFSCSFKYNNNKPVLNFGFNNENPVAVLVFFFTMLSRPLITKTAIVVEIQSAPCYTLLNKSASCTDPDCIFIVFTLGWSGL